MNAEEIKKDFPIFRVKVHGKPLTYLDSAATSQKPLQVIEAVSDYYKNYNANIHRGIYELSEKATAAYVESKEKVSRLINAKSIEEIVYVRNTTEAINLVALSWAEQNLKKGDVVLITEMEHHSNIVPWQLLSRRKGIIFKYVRLNSAKDGLDMDDFKEKLQQYKPRLVSVVHASNVLGTINDVRYIARMAHRAGAKVLVDGAQSVPHIGIDVSEIDSDFLAFSGHKMLGPAGIGVLYAKEEILDETEPMFGGGDMIKDVKLDSSVWNDLPWKFEAGTSNIEGGIGLGAAVDYLTEIGMQNIRRHEEKLTKYALERLSEIKGLTVYGPRKAKAGNRVGVVSFSMKNVHSHDIASVFDSEGIAIRAGHHCAIPLVRGVLGEPALSRMSFYIYNSEEDIDKAVSAILKTKEIFKV
ncbi:MAG: aminotransferase class V-fold PLP-dependent enzyme [Candidatus Micrarchaeia archaeon]